MKITKPLVKDNCKDCVSKCEHAGKDREFVCKGGVGCKKTKREFDLNNVKIAWDFVDNDLAKKGYKKVVMCCECKYCEVVIDSIIYEPKWFCTRIVGSIPVDPTDYCSRAKMKGAE